MLRNAALLLALSGTVFGCSDSGISGIAPPPSPPPRPALAVTSVSPDYAFASSADITVTITGSAFQPFSIQGYSQALWRVDQEREVPLRTTFVSDTLLTARVPSDLLRDPLSASLIVQDVVYNDGGDRTTESKPISFIVLCRDTSFSVVPTSAAVGSPDLTITVRGAGFISKNRFNGSKVVLSVYGSHTWLSTSFVSSSELTAVIPAALLAMPIVATVSVWTGDVMGDLPLVRTGAANFTVTP